MSYFTTRERAIEWATNYGLPYYFEVIFCPYEKLYFVRWDYREPEFKTSMTHI